MTEKEKKILKTFEEVIPKLTDMEKAQLISFGEGLIFFKMDSQKKEDTSIREGDAGV